MSNLEQQSRNQFCNHGTHGIHRKRLTTKHTNHTKKTIVNFLLRKNLTIDFVKNVQKKQEYGGLYYGISNVQVKNFRELIPTCLRESHCHFYQEFMGVCQKSHLPPELWHS